MKLTGLAVRHGRIREGFAILAFIAVFARALIPVGFMPGTVHGQPQLILCDGHHALHGHAGLNTDSPCPFALSGGAAPPPTLPDWSIAGAAPESRRPFDGSSVVFAPPYRHTAPRGPPVPA